MGQRDEKRTTSLGGEVLDNYLNISLYISDANEKNNCTNTYIVLRFKDFELPIFFSIT
jgi:hypothetical protein